MTILSKTLMVPLCSASMLLLDNKTYYQPMDQQGNIMR